MADLAAQIWRNYVIDGIPSSGAKKPEKIKIREWGTWVEGRIQPKFLNPTSDPSGSAVGDLMWLDGTTAYRPEVNDVLEPQQVSYASNAQAAGLYIRHPSKVGNSKVSPAPAEELGAYWMRLADVPAEISHPDDIYPDMAVGWGAGLPKMGGRGTAFGYFAYSNTTYVDTTNTPIPVGGSAADPNDGETKTADSVKYAGLLYLPMPWGTLYGERAGRLSRDNAATMIGQQAGLGSPARS